MESIIEDHVHIILTALEVACGKIGICQIATRSLRVIAKQLERGCRNFAIDETEEKCLPVVIVAGGDVHANHFMMRYSAEVYRIIDLLRDDNCELIKALAEKKVQPIDVARTSTKILCPSILACEYAECEIRKKQKIEVKISHAYPCPRCKEKEAFFFECQVRASDEGSTIFLTCKACKYRWKI